MQEEFKHLGELQNRLIGLDKAAIRTVNIEDVDNKLSAQYQAIYNTSRNEVIGVKKAGAALIQHATVFNTFIDVVNALGLSSYGSLFNEGRRVTMTALFKGRNVAVKGDSIQTGLQITSEFGRPVGFSVYAYREICANGMLLGKVQKQMVSVQMESQLEGSILNCVKRMVEVDNKLGILIENAMKDSIEGKLAMRLLTSMMSNKKHRDEIIIRFDAEKDKSRWGLYNAITNYATHGELISTSNEAFLQARAQQLLINYPKVLETMEEKETREQMREMQ